MKQKVLDHFACQSMVELKKKSVLLSKTGKDDGLKSKHKWLKLHRRFVSIPSLERPMEARPTGINGIDVQQLFAPGWSLD